MRVLALAFALSSFTFCFMADASTVADFSGNKGSGTPNITIGYQFHGFKDSEFQGESEVLRWLKELETKARGCLWTELGLRLKLQRAYIAKPIDQLKEEIENWTKGGGTVDPFKALYYLKKFFDRRYNTDIVCLITKKPLYDTKTANYFGFAIHQTLCETEVPMLLTYDKEKVNETGHEFCLFIRDSIKNFKFFDWWKKTRVEKKKYFDECNRYILDSTRGLTLPILVDSPLAEV
uniref:Putative ixodes 26 kDa salivary protein n=1 Tax=Ixodes ricinus TaxID=34613 RepID=A0A0K8RMF2_IXORI